MLGPLRVLDDGTELDLGGPRQRAVLAILLASHPRAVSVERIVDEVWGDDPPQTAHHVVSTYVSNLRRVLGDRLVSDGRRHRIDLNGDESDTDELATALERSRTLLDIDPAAANTELSQVSRLRRGPPFGDLADDMATVRIASDALDEQYLLTVERRFEAALRLGRHEDVLPELESHVRDHPLREHATAQLMIALYRSGRQADALGEYRALRRRLVEELGIDPSPALADLEERILLQDPGLSLRPPHNVPVPASSFVGRRAELGDLTKQLGAFRLVTLVGVGGVGKTRLAREAAMELLDDFPDGVWWIDVTALEEPDDVLARTAQILGVFAQPGLTLEHILHRYLSGRTTLLVFDNCERLVPGIGPIIARLLEAGPDVTVLATSRRPLGTTGEVRAPVPPMSLPEMDHPDYLPGTSDAERLFMARVEEATARAGWGEPDITRESARICIRLDGLPLAIEMAAARTTVLSPGQIAADLASGTDLLVAAETDRHPRQRTLDAMMEWSYALLDPVERVAFERLSVFSAAFGIDAARAVAGFEPIRPNDLLDAIAGIASASMLVVERADGAARYRMLATVRDFAHRKLAESPDEREAARRHARYHIALAEAAGEVRFTPSCNDALARLDSSRDDIVSALEWSLDHEPPRAIEAACGLNEYWSRRGDVALAYRFGRSMLENAPAATDEQRAEALLCASFGAGLSGDFELAARGPAEAIDLAAEAGWRTRLWAFHARGQISTILGDLPTVEAMGRAIVDLCAEEGLDLPVAYGESLLGLFEFFSDRDYGAAARHLDAAVEGMRALGDHEGMKIYGLATAISAAALQGDYDAAERYATEAISLPGLPWTGASYIIFGGYALHPKGELDRARRVLERGTRIAYETSTEIWMRTGFLFLARLAAEEEDYERAALLFGACSPNLPAWGRQPRWWDLAEETRTALGEERYDQLHRRGERASPDELMPSIEEHPRPFPDRFVAP